ncbi:MAG: hypothetical protein MZW92_21275 [Comamonadaceae bacterium]|nr:hypothetical protein [Comamonadaceae bacterium]
MGAAAGASVPVWIGIIANIALIGLLMRLDLSAYAAGHVGALIPVTALSFLSNRYFVFKVSEGECIALADGQSPRRTPPT